MRGEKAIEIAKLNGNEGIVEMLRKDCIARDLLLLRPPIQPIMPKYYASVFCLLFIFLTLLPDFITIF